jgi:L-fuconolactonase
VPFNSATGVEYSYVCDGTGQGLMKRIDTHQHFWQYRPIEQTWIDDSMLPLRRDFLPDQIIEAMEANGVDESIAIQARQTIEETRWLLELASQNHWLAGVVGWLPLKSPEVELHLEQWRTEPLLKGVRHIAQAEPDGFLLESTFQRGVAALRTADLAYDILIRANQLDEAIEFVDRNPNQPFVLDHLAKPKIAAGEREPWKTKLRALAERENVVAKISGLVTEADWSHWTEEQLLPYMDWALEVFGPARLMLGSDWPVCTLASSYNTWWSFLDRWTGRLSEDERMAILGGTATRIYRTHRPSQEIA